LNSSKLFHLFFK